MNSAKEKGWSPVCASHKSTRGFNCAQDMIAEIIVVIQSFAGLKGVE
jgi:hypothetical protein